VTQTLPVHDEQEEEEEEEEEVAPTLYGQM